MQKEKQEIGNKHTQSRKKNLPLVLDKRMKETYWGWEGIL